MYSWGEDTTDWKGSGSYKYDSARKPYLDRLAADAAKRGPRTYIGNREPNLKLVDPRGKEISSDSKNPIIVAVDVTGSMCSWPGEFFDRAPLLYQTLSQYREDAEFCFAAIGDAHCDRYPLQVNSFGKGLDLEGHIKALGCEGGGGGQISESYELFGYYLLNHCKTPNATSPFLFIYGDEKFYNEVGPEQVRHYVGDELQAEANSKDVWKGLLQRFNLYLLHKPYGSENEPDIDKEVIAHWADAIGRQRIIEIPGSERAVDIAMGIVAKHWGKFGDFENNLDARHDEEDVKQSVYATLRFVPDKGSKKSVMAKSKGGKTKSLSELFDDATGKSRGGK